MIFIAPGVLVADVTHVTAEGNYVRVHLNEGVSTRIRGVMKQWQGMLVGRGFVQLGRSTSVNPTAVKRVEQVDRNLSIVFIRNARRPLRLGRRASRQIRQLLPQMVGGSASDSATTARSGDRTASSTDR